MSAFVVSPKTMHRVVSMIVSCDRYHVQRFQTFAGIPTDAEDSEDRIGQLLYGMNIDAVQQRYPDTIEHPPVANYNYKYSYLGEDILGGFKALECLLYQCAEGTVYASQLWMELEAVKNRVACEIVSSLPDYEKARWD